MTRNKKPPPFAEGVWGWVSFPSLRGSGFNHNEKQSINPSLRENSLRSFSRNDETSSYNDSVVNC
ncbi:hypothetical protein [Helicobacter macacae]|uniref:hypothetical protein n=1 Tax=Helicobacter macacae TaxID=398626 RepID=UPI000415EF9B|nr:hypothetical protein [Helicobacter macacae]